MSTYVRLRVASEVYAMPVENVVEVAVLGDLAPVPGSPPELLGVRNMRGTILPVVDLALLLKVPRMAPPSRLVVTEAAGRQIGFAVDSVYEVSELAELTEETDSPLLLGAILAHGELVGVIDVGRTLDEMEGGSNGRGRR
jgi:purine-binding chemotaxis protein CheW